MFFKICPVVLYVSSCSSQNIVVKIGLRNFMLELNRVYYYFFKTIGLLEHKVYFNFQEENENAAFSSLVCSSNPYNWCSKNILWKNINHYMFAGLNKKCTSILISLGFSHLSPAAQGYITNLDTSQVNAFYIC